MIHWLSVASLLLKMAIILAKSNKPALSKHFYIFSAMVNIKNIKKSKKEYIMGAADLNQQFFSLFALAKFQQNFSPTFFNFTQKLGLNSEVRSGP
jgi:hypothetical protein